MLHPRLLTLLPLMAILADVLATSVGHARITKIVVDRVESPTFDGQEFGTTGRYEKIAGRMFGEVDPWAPGHAGIVNLDKAPKNKVHQCTLRKRRNQQWKKN